MLLLIAFVLMAGSRVASADDADSTPLFSQTKDDTAVGQPIGGTFKAGLSPQGQQILATALIDILGAGMQALMALSNPPNTIDGTTYTEFYSFGKRVFTQSAQLNLGNSANFSAGLSPAEVRVPVVIYPVGPVLVQVDGGARFQADLKGSLTPEVAIPVTSSTLSLQLQAAASAAGFIEGYAKFLVVRGGVGGELSLLDAQADVNARFAFDGTPPFANVDAFVDFLSGAFYAFFDYFDLAQFGWKRLLNYDLYRWNGYCFATEKLICPSQ